MKRHKIIDFFLSFISSEEKTKEELVEKLLKLNQNRNFKKEKNIYQFLPYKNILVSKLLKELKFKRKIQNAEIFAEILSDNFIDLLSDWHFYEDFKNPILIHIPIHFLRRISRPYNQNEEILKIFFKKNPDINLIWEKNLLKKNKYTKPQPKLKNKKDRIENIKNSFKITNPQKIKNKNIIIFDDIYTSGATINEVIKLLKKYKVRKIKVVTIAG